MMRLRKLLGIPVLLALAALAMAVTACETISELAEQPDTTAAAVLAHLEEEDYRNNWERWPGLGELYPSEEPHGLLLTTYMNTAAFDARRDWPGEMPNGAMIVKENYTADGVFDATTVMYKHIGYNPDHNNWFWLKAAADGTVQAEGMVEGCQTCHGKRSSNDYIMTETLE